jgi:hypothetical protein
VFRRISWLPGGGGLTAPYTRSNRPLWIADFRGVSTVVGACVVRLLVEFVPRTSSTPVVTWCWQREGRSAECVILGVRPSGFILSEFQSPSRRIFIGSHSLPPPWSPNRSFRRRIRFLGRTFRATAPKTSSRLVFQQDPGALCPDVIFVRLIEVFRYR